MLDTLLDIGRALRESRNGLKHHRYVKSAPQPDKDNPVRFWEVPVASNGSFDFSQRRANENENTWKTLFYLNYKTSDADSLKKYVFGDVYRSITKTGEDGNFRLGDPKSGASAFRVNSFMRGEADAALFESEHLTTFRNSFRSQLDEIEAFLRAEPNAYIHFDHAGEAWHNLPELKSYNSQALRNFAHETEHGFVLQAYLYKTLGSGSSQIPGFGIESNKQHRTRIFKSEEDLLDLIYAIDYSTKPIMRIADLKIIILPRANRLTADVGQALKAEQIERFFEPRKPENQESAEAQLALSLTEIVTEADSFMASLEADGANNITQFDFIFSKTGSSASSPDTDMIEISGLDRSKLSHIAERIRKIRHEVESQRERELPPSKKGYFPLSVNHSLHNILADTTRAKKKYQSHLLKVLPQIYTNSYFQDLVLLPALVEKTEFNIRNDAANFGFLRYDFYFLTRIQNQGDQNLMDIQQSQSYQVGKLLGTMARPLRTKINSFDKNYAGLISRRVTTLSDVIALHGELNQKLIMHKRAGTAGMFSPQLTEVIKNFSGAYDKNECAFGFFESYFAPKQQDDKDDDETVDPEAA